MVSGKRYPGTAEGKAEKLYFSGTGLLADAGNYGILVHKETGKERNWMFIKKLTQQVVHTYDKPIVETKAGKLRGLIAEGTYIFRGVTYAAARRFHMPEPVAPWEGVRDAVVYGYVCPELSRGGIGGDYVVRHVFYPQDEDCLSLNIWTQSLDPSAKKPVLFWLHGGGYTSGSSIEHYAYDGEEMSRFGDVVVVTVNHRLNVLGYLNLSDYGEEYRYSGNAGQADIVAALQWVRDNIAGFGGDPNNVTIFGQSGGGGKVTTLMQMPAADGLYHRAVIMSGVFRKEKKPDAVAAEVRTSKRLAALVLEHAGISPENVRRLEEIPYHDLAAAANKATEQLSRELGERVGWGPVADGEYYVGYPFDVGFRPETADIPLMVGSVLSEFSTGFSDERAVGSKYGWSEALKTELIRERAGEAGDKLIEAFQKAYPGRCTADLLYMDSRVRDASAEYARLRAEKCTGRVYNYLYCLEMPFNEGTIPCHNADIPYVFHNAQYLEAFYIPDVSERVQDIVCGSFIHFARTGDPNGQGVPAWEPVSAENGAAMLFDRESQCLCGHDRKLIALLSETQFDPSQKKK